MTQVLERFGGDMPGYPDPAGQEGVGVPYADLPNGQTAEAALQAALEAKRIAERHAAEAQSARHISSMLQRHDPMYAGMFNNPDFSQR